MNDQTFKPLSDPSAWYGGDFEADRTWEYQLDDDHIAELAQALAAVKDRGLALARIGPDDFPLPTLSARLKSLGDDLRTGRGFALVRGFPVEGFSTEDLSLMYYGLCRHIGTGMTQNSDGGLIHYVTDGALKPNQGKRGVGFPQRSRLHVDLTDIVSLLCVRQAADDPHSQLASAITLYNEILKRRPDLLPLLFEGFEWDRMDEHGDGESATSGYRVPLFSQAGGEMSCRYNRGWLTAAHVSRTAPLSAEDEEAFRLIDEINDETCLTFPFGPGDIQFCSNYTVMHGREAHALEANEERKRLLVRIWLNVPDFRSFSDEAIVRYGIGYHGNLGWTADQFHAGAHKTPRLRRDDGAIHLSADLGA
jgi:hypothetical protein